MKQYLPVRGHTEWRYVCTDCIVRIESDRNYSRIVLNDGSVLLVAKTLKTYDGCLPPCFVRIHKSCLLNVHFIAKMGPLKTVLLTDGTQLTLARRRATLFRKSFRNGLFELAA